jgi:NADH-quinone oxidoreductase subunit K
MDLMFFLVFLFLIFCFGLYGIFANKKNIILVIISIELMLLAVNSMLLLCSVYLDDRIGQILTLFILTVAAAESSIGLSIIICYYRINGTIVMEFINQIKG